MIPAPLTQIAKWCGGNLLSGNERTLITRISKDTRTIQSGDLYLGIRGEQYDGNAFVAQAAAVGAVAAIVDSETSTGLPDGFGIIRVKDSIVALQALAKMVRAEMKIRAVCITGSNGKTSTKDFTAEVLSSRFQTSRTPGNLNNHIGLPLTIVNTEPGTEAVVWEIGMSHPGEIEPLAKLAKPDIAIITNIGVAHIEYMGSREATAKEKGRLLEMLEPGGLAILNAQDNFSDELAKRTRARVLRVGIESGEIRASTIQQSNDGSSFTIDTPSGRIETRITVPGLHMVLNGLFAIATGLEAGISLADCAEALSRTKLTGGRLEWKTIRDIHFLDDSYNANPDSMEAALATLAQIPSRGRKIAALGRMGELGEHAESGYRRVGKKAAQLVDILLTVGKEAAAMAKTARSEGLKNVVEAADTSEASQWLREFVHEGDVVLVKGSRSAKMEHVIGNFQ
ncbi:MAG: UDP-N-acetylmuramoyl-tripeptide--D-alanyl-D-alanine ligase [Chthoniobacterales bacterium]